MRNFFPIPLENLPGSNICNVSVTAHHWAEGKLLLDFEYYAMFYRQWNPVDGKFYGGTGRSVEAVALLDPVTSHWEVIADPEAEKPLPQLLLSTLSSPIPSASPRDRSAFFRGELYNCDREKIRKLDLASHRWQPLNIAGEDRYGLASINGHLYAAGASTILEITDGGKGTHVLASRRRNPPLSPLDSMTSYGQPVLFEGPNHSLRA